MDLALDDMRKMDWVAAMPNLRSLSIAHKAIAEMEGLDKCLSLESLWLFTNEIEVIDGLHLSQNLRQLFLGSKRIRRIEGLEQCKNLTKLWLDENLIREIDGLSSL